MRQGPLVDVPPLRNHPGQRQMSLHPVRRRTGQHRCTTQAQSTTTHLETQWLQFAVDEDIPSGMLVAQMGVWQTTPR